MAIQCLHVYASVISVFIRHSRPEIEKSRSHNFLKTFSDVYASASRLPRSSSVSALSRWLSDFWRTRTEADGKKLPTRILTLIENSKHITDFVYEHPHWYYDFLNKTALELQRIPGFKGTQKRGRKENKDTYQLPFCW